MSSEIKVTVDGIDDIENHRFTSLLKAWLESRGDFTLIMRGPKGAAGTVSRAVKDDAPTVIVGHERDMRDMAAETLRGAGADLDLTTDHYAALGRAMVGLMRQGEAKATWKPGQRPNGGLLRLIQAGLPETRVERPIYYQGPEFRGGRQCQMLLSQILDFLRPADPEAGSFAREASRKSVDIEALKPSDIGRLGFLVMQLAQHLPSGHVDFVDAVIEASKVEMPV